MIWKLQKKTLLPLQIFGYGITLCIGITISLITLTIYTDLKPILESESDVFNDNAVIVNKKISILSNINKDKIYFTEEELKDFEDQDFVKEIARFNKATNFNIFLSLDMFNLGSQLFFESIPDKYLDIDSDKWKWEEGSDFVPIMMPEDYLKLYNLTFSPQSKDLPLLSPKTISKVEFDVHLSGDNKRKTFRGSVVGFSSKINTILVPEDFLNWANKEFGNHEKNKASRILVEFHDPNDERIIEFLNENNYEVNKEKMEKNKLIFFFKMAFVFVFVIALIIILLSITLILLSVNLIFQKNKAVLINLYLLGYQIKQISYYYKLLISIVTLFSIFISLMLTLMIRRMYSEKLVSYFDFEMSNTFIYTNVMIISVLLLILLNILIERKIRNLILR
ncbi:MAG: ABC transporter permease [Flavobacteriaceae bacterium]|nr:ABC transporter permease [Flavobacteriaceae bacterium]MBT7620104.1 ABC transporter permease [Flavobacteriales bacterium]